MCENDKMYSKAKVYKVYYSKNTENKIKTKKLNITDRRQSKIKSNKRKFNRKLYKIK